VVLAVTTMTDAFRAEERYSVTPLPGEEWRPVVGYEGRYSVSNLGRLRSFARPTYGRLMSPCMNSQGYLIVPLRKDGARWLARVHRVVAEAFCAPKPGADVVRHLNDIKLDNRASNLAWGTKRENSADARRNGKSWWLRKTHCVNGHELTPENTATRRDHVNERVCRECNRIAQRKAYWKKKADVA
jgi:hypothetical protein